MKEECRANRAHRVVESHSISATPYNKHGHYMWQVPVRTYIDMIGGMKTTGSNAEGHPMAHSHPIDGLGRERRPRRSSQRKIRKLGQGWAMTQPLWRQHKFRYEIGEA